MYSKSLQNIYDPWFPPNMEFESYLMLEYFFRRTHNEENYLRECCRKLFQSIRYDSREKCLNIDNYYNIDFLSANLGAYYVKRDERIHFDIYGGLPCNYYKTENNGINIFHLINLIKGLNPLVSIYEIYRHMGLRFNEVDRYKYSEKKITCSKLCFFRYF